MATVTFFSVPPDAVTVMPVLGSAALASLPGVIVTAGPAGVGFADGDADAAAVPDGEPPPTYFTTVVVLVQAASANASTDTATPPEIVRIPDMSPP